MSKFEYFKTRIQKDYKLNGRMDMIEYDEFPFKN